MLINEQILTENSLGVALSNAIRFRSLPRFRWYGYKEGFSPDLVKQAIEAVGVNNNDFVLDPFNGSGTVTLTASLNNIRSIGIEVNPFAAFMAEVKMESASSVAFIKNADKVWSGAKKGMLSPLSTFSTFSEQGGRPKWLFNGEVLDSFEGGWQSASSLSDSQRKIVQLSLIGAAMDNCNATKDGKCLKYRKNWEDKGFDKSSFLNSFEQRIQNNKEDLESSEIKRKAFIINGDARKEIKALPEKFKLCITSPPYLNSFDYTDIYRPELFLGKFISSSQELKSLRQDTIRSHVEIALPVPRNDYFGEIYYSVYHRIYNSGLGWSKQIPRMIQSYFEDMEGVLSDLYEKAKKGGELWLVVANSVYFGIEIPVDLILAEIGTHNKWHLVRIEVLRYINRRKTKYCGNINKVRESLVVFQK